MTEKVKKFWMVYGLHHSAPVYQHDTKLSAQREASRLAQIATGTTFVVLSVVDAFRADAPIVNQCKIVKRCEDDEIPF